ncbi:MAG: hypothetical protein JWP94_1494 [Mucilaginibacter sp.]|jgi:hypothetical protein|nr:hypothetical protein [Mucilaginibacter sp.]
MINGMVIKSKFLGVRTKVGILAILYLISFDWMYISWLSGRYSYMGFEYHPVRLDLLLVSHIVAWLPVLWIPIKLRRPSVIIYWFLFLMTYIPAVLLPVYIKLSNEGELYILILSLLAGMFIISFSYFLPLIKLKRLKIDGKKFMGGVYVITILLILYVIYIFKGNMRLVGLSDIYDLRFGSDALTQGNYVAYAIMALGSCFFPLLLSLGLIRKSYWLIIFGSVGQIFLYSTEGAKTYLFSSVITIMIFLLIRKNSDRFGFKFFSFFVFLVVVLNALALYSPDSWLLVVTTIASIVFMRTISMGGMLTAQYFYFFSTHPKTYYSHINIVGKMLTYPYGNEPLGRVIGYYFTGESLLNSNANFWATDGIAAAGITGIILISILCSAMFYVFDSAASRHDIVFSTACVIIICMSLLNVSLFTTFLSGGFGLMILILYLLPAQARILK